MMDPRSASEMLAKYGTREKLLNMTMEDLLKLYPEGERILAPDPNHILVKDLYKDLLSGSRADAVAVKRCLWILSRDCGFLPRRALVGLAADIAEHVRHHMFDYRSTVTLDAAHTFAKEGTAFDFVDKTLRDAKWACFAAVHGSRTSLYAANAAYFAGMSGRVPMAVNYASTAVLNAVEGEGGTVKAYQQQLGLLRAMEGMFG